LLRLAIPKQMLERGIINEPSVAPNFSLSNATENGDLSLASR